MNIKYTNSNSVFFKEPRSTQLLKSYLYSNRGRVLEALMQQKASGKIKGIFGRLVRVSCLILTQHGILKKKKEWCLNTLN